MDDAEFGKDEVAVDEADEPIVGGKNDLTTIAGGDESARGADAGVDHGDVDGAVGEVVENLPEDECAVDHVVWPDEVGDVDELGGRGELEDDALYAGDVVVGLAEVGGEGDDRHSVLSLKPKKSLGLEIDAIR